MAARRRASSRATATVTATDTDKSKSETPTRQEHADPPIAPPKSGLIFKLCLFFAIPYFYLLFYHYKIESELQRSILINAGLSLAGFFITQKMIPVASRYVLRRNLFGYDINKKGTPQGTIKVWVFIFIFFFSSFGFWFLSDFVKWICISFAIWWS